MCHQYQRLNLLFLVNFPPYSPTLLTSFSTLQSPSLIGGKDPEYLRVFLQKFYSSSEIAAHVQQHEHEHEHEHEQPLLA